MEENSFMDSSIASQKCRACQSTEIHFLMNGIILNKNISYFECHHCGYIQTEEPYWLDQAYSKAINDSDTGILIRNQINAKVVLATLSTLGKIDGRVVDYAGGYGILTRILRDYGVNATWSDRYCENLLAKGFEHNGEKADLITAFEAFEHFTHPQEDLDKMLEIAPNILLSTEIIPSPAPKQDDWWYYGKEHGQHIGFFKICTLEKMANKHKKKLITNGKSHHLITEKNINVLHWKTMQIVSKINHRILTRKIKSKTWEDHLKTKN